MKNGVSDREHIVALLNAFEKRYESERQLTKEAFEEFKITLSEKDKTAATEIERRFNAYPTIRDFTDLKETVLTSFGAEVGRAKAYAVGMGVVGIIISLAIGWFAVK